jgi:hypothetical protein
VSESLANPTLTALGVDFNYKHDDLTFSAGYRHQVTGHRTDDPKVTQLGLLMATYAPRLGRHTIAIRGRLEDTVHANSNPYRLRLRAEYRYAIEAWGPVSYLFANDEVFYQFSNDEAYRNRFQAGASLKIGKRASLLVYYQRQDDKLNNPGALNVLGLILKTTVH